MKKDDKKVSLAVVRRLPRYYRHLTELKAQGVVRISSSALGQMMGVTASQIRQDLFCFGDFGQQGYGYNVENLRDRLGEILGIDRGHTAVVVGAGNLGRALMLNFNFARVGFSLEAAFDIDPEKAGTTLNGIPIYPAQELLAYLAEHPTSVGVLTVPGSAANDTAQCLVQGGVKGIWNFTNRELTLQKKDVTVENVHFADSLLTLSYLIADNRQGEGNE